MNKLEDDVAAFLNGGGEVKQVASGVSGADGITHNPSVDHDEMEAKRRTKDANYVAEPRRHAPRAPDRWGSK